MVYKLLELKMQVPLREGCLGSAPVEHSRKALVRVNVSIGRSRGWSGTISRRCTLSGWVSSLAQVGLPLWDGIVVGRLVHVEFVLRSPCLDCGNQPWGQTQEAVKPSHSLNQGKAYQVNEVDKEQRRDFSETGYSIVVRGRICVWRGERYGSRTPSGHPERALCPGLVSHLVHLATLIGNARATSPEISSTAGMGVVADC